jgi:hypothetical protein
MARVWRDTRFFGFQFKMRGCQSDVLQALLLGKQRGIIIISVCASVILFKTFLLALLSPSISQASSSCSLMKIPVSQRLQSSA